MAQAIDTPISKVQSSAGEPMSQPNTEPTITLSARFVAAILIAIITSIGGSALVNKLVPPSAPMPVVNPTDERRLNAIEETLKQLLQYRNEDHDALIRLETKIEQLTDEEKPQRRRR
jgi:hypothetical protein